ncbi:MAG: WecB/TagA/CpsF family glycosyltransferase [Lachnospiraceae bacterium]|nr:WecB/TagA/CpsF family glycosyltransferase [Lachnospiraceae bacterium]
MSKQIEVLNVPFDVLSMEEAVSRVISYMDTNGSHIICTPNPEIVMAAGSDRELMDILKAADLVVPDGVGIVWALKKSGGVHVQRIAGYDLIQNVFAKIKSSDRSVYFFGGAPGVAADAARAMQKKHPGLKIVGTRNGYFTERDEIKIIDEIKKAKPDLLLVGLGSPKQEKWMYNNLRLTGVKSAIGVGGSFDVMSGRIKRAPKIFQRLGLEWFYRLIKQPVRFKRILKLPNFVFKVIFSLK